ncbi:MAG: HYC_CC_PP family protein [Bacteroidales bacterium]
MKSTSTHIRFVSIVLSVLIFFSSTGLTVSAHYCSSDQTLIKSIFSDKLSCDHDIAEQSSCDTTSLAQDCCHHKAEQVKQKDNCCKDFRQYFKMNVDADVSVLKTSISDFVVITENPAFSAHILPETDLVVVIRESDHRAPILSGIKLLTSLHQLKIDINCSELNS